ncbi:MAG: sigma-70 family RNA polymerase sigma factor [Dysgonamonadaceae bacterium]|nr:sigma-70 family RNA polymerase sigma factor [Dysgonamonadaceae bacterium]
MIYTTYAEDLFAYGMSCYPDKNLVEDVIHDLFLDIYRRKENLDGIGNMKRYLFSAFRYKIYSQLKNKYLFEAFDSDDCTELLYESDTLEQMEALEKENEQRQLVDRLLSQLNPHQREVIHLRFIEKLSFDEIADVMHINRQSVQNLFGRAINKLRKKFAL